MADPTAPLPPPQTQAMYKPDGTPVQVPVGQVASAIRTGGLTFAKGQTVTVEGADGQLVPMSGAQAAAYLKSSESYGRGAASAGDYVAQQERKESDSAGRIIGAGAAGAARSLSLGMSDAAIAGLGGEAARKELQKAQKYSPVASTVGEVGGMLAPALFTGGASGSVSALGKAGRAATALPRAVTAGAETGGRLAERGVIGLGAAEGGNVAGAARVLATNAIEGGAQGIGQAISDASIKGEPIEVEKILAHGGKAALLGAGLGGALHGTVGLAKSGLSKAGGAIKEGVTNATEAAREKLVNKIAGSLEADAAKLEGKVAPELERAPQLGKFDPGVEGEAKGIAGAGGRERGGPRMKDDPSIREGNPATGNRVPPAEGEGLPGLEETKSRIRDFLNAASKGDTAAMEKQGNEFILRRTAEQLGIDLEGKGAKQLAIEIADNRSRASLSTTNAKVQKNWDKLNADARSAVPELIEEDLRRVAGRDARAIMSREEMAAAAPALKREAGQDMERVLADFDKAAAGDATKLPSMSTAKERIEREVIEPMLAEVRVVMPDGSIKWKDAGTRAKIAEGLRAQTDAFEGAASFRQMHKDRVFFDEGINFAATSKADVMKSKAFRTARNIMDDELALAGDRAVGATGGESALKWKSAKNRWAAANAIEENSRIGAMVDAKNRVNGMSEQHGAIKGGALGTAVGGALGSIVPVFGTALGSGIGGLLGSAIGRHAAAVERRVGDQYVAKIAREAGTDGVLRGAMKEVDMAMDSKLGTYLGEKGIQGAAAAKNKIGDLLEKAGVEAGQTAVKATEAGAKVDKAAVRAADAAERTATRTEEKVAAEAEKLAAQVEAAPPGAVRRALVEKLAAAKEAGAAKVQAIREKAAELGEAAGRVRKALPGAPALAVEAERIQGRAAASRDEEYQKTRQRYADLAQSPARLAEATAAVRVGRPDLADGLSAKLAEIATYVDKRAPVSTRALSTLTPGAVKDTVSPGEQARFLAMAKVAEEPLSILDDLESGRVTAAQMRVVKDLYPTLHAEICQRVIEKLADRKEPLPYKQRLQIGMLIGAPTDASLEPGFIASTQATFSQPVQSGAPPRRSDSAKPTGVAAATTKMQELGALDLDKRPYEGVHGWFSRARQKPEAGQLGNNRSDRPRDGRRHNARQLPERHAQSSRGDSGPARERGRQREGYRHRGQHGNAHARRGHAVSVPDSAHLLDRHHDRGVGPRRPLPALLTDALRRRPCVGRRAPVGGRRPRVLAARPRRKAQALATVQRREPLSRHRANDALHDRRPGHYGPRRLVGRHLRQREARRAVDLGRAAEIPHCWRRSVHRRKHVDAVRRCLGVGRRLRRVHRREDHDLQRERATVGYGFRIRIHRRRREQRRRAEPAQLDRRGYGPHALRLGSRVCRRRASPHRR